MTDSHGEFARKLRSEDKILIRLVEDLFDGNWDAMIEDVRDRQAGRPYLFEQPWASNAAERLSEHLDWIQRLRDYEAEHKIRLVNYLEDD